MPGRFLHKSERVKAELHRQVSTPYQRPCPLLADLHSLKRPRENLGMVPLVPKVLISWGRGDVHLALAVLPGKELSDDVCLLRGLAGDGFMLRAVLSTFCLDPT